ncbi:hypothetical protein J7337_001762 [Fusarium musae]|uniref:Uncharacterized protein n=1 Tax=Fusarium musae TaxID=1042133 RepID=A0A9P8DU45_9HYPO|nr:hypothetical protein J7337_001762 [Fusarium musae]KAG9508199.1 hypothetical protein J7337_001762 [Fusarium musae]
MKPSFLFLQVISHPAWPTKLSISTQIGTIYTLYAGTNEDQSIGLLSFLCEQALESTELIADILESKLPVSAKEFFDLVESSDKRRGKQPIASTFPKNIEYPGGRHDNDFADITKIAILPTYGEVVSENYEYLPSINFTDPHVLDDPLQ